MTAFRFRLERVLEWRRLQMRAEEEKLAVLQRRLESAKHRIQALTSAELKHEWSLRKLPSVAGSELQALAAFQAGAKKQRQAFEAELKQCEKLIEAQRARLLQARRNFRVLEKLRERRHEAWSCELDREIENAAAEAHFSKLIRSRSEE